MRDLSRARVAPNGINPMFAASLERARIADARRAARQQQVQEASKDEGRQ